MADADKGDLEGNRGKVMEGVASIALLPSGSISGHFIQLPNSVCYGLYGTGIHDSSLHKGNLSLPVLLTLFYLFNNWKHLEDLTLSHMLLAENPLSFIWFSVVYFLSLLILLRKTFTSYCSYLLPLIYVFSS